MIVTTDAVEVRTPRESEWFRVKPGVERIVNTLVLRDSSTRDLYLVYGSLWPALESAMVPVCLRAWTDRTGRMAVWSIDLPTLDACGPEAPLRAISVAAEKEWCCFRDTADGRRVLFSKSNDDLLEPEWPNVPFLDIVSLAFRDRKIVSLDHPIVHRGGEK